MIRLLIWILLLYVGYRIVISLFSGRKAAAVSAGAGAEAEVTHRDPVCGVYVVEDQAVVGRLEGQRHYFCSINCLEKYREQLEQGTKTG